MINPHTLYNASVGLQTSLPQLVEVVQHVGVRPVHLGLAGLHQCLQDVVEVLPELRPSSESHVAKHRQNLRLDAAMDRVVAQVSEENLHDLVTPLQHSVAHGATDIPHQANSRIADLERILRNIQWMGALYYLVLCSVPQSDQ